MAPFPYTNKIRRDMILVYSLQVTLVSKERADRSIDLKEVSLEVRTDMSSLFVLPLKCLHPHISYTLLTVEHGHVLPSRSFCSSPHNVHFTTTLSLCQQFRTQIQPRTRKGHAEYRDSVRVWVTFTESSVILQLLTNSSVQVCFISIDFNFINLCPGWQYISRFLLNPRSNNFGLFSKTSEH